MRQPVSPSTTILRGSRTGAGSSRSPTTTRRARAGTGTSQTMSANCGARCARSVIASVRPSALAAGHDASLTTARACGSPSAAYWSQAESTAANSMPSGVRRVKAVPASANAAPEAHVTRAVRATLHPRAARCCSHPPGRAGARSGIGGVRRRRSRAARVSRSAPVSAHRRQGRVPAVDRRHAVDRSSRPWICVSRRRPVPPRRGGVRDGSPANPRDVRSMMYEAVAYDRLNEPARVAKLVALARRAAPHADPPMRPDTIPGATLLMNGHYAQAFAHWSDFAEHPYNAPIYEDAHAIEPYRDGLKLAVRGAYCDALRVLRRCRRECFVRRHPVHHGRVVLCARKSCCGALRVGCRGDPKRRPSPGYWVAGPIQWTALNLLVQAPR